ncbi:MAG: amidoligase family protein [Clostridiales bacterium]|nr:amidoligase family protein [Clostridiales bacterium]
MLFEGKLYCKECYEECTVVCDCCGERVHVDDTESDSETTVCCFCADESYYRCTECECLVYTDDLYEDEFGNYLCYDCWKRLEELEESKAIHRYSYKPSPVFHSEIEEKRYFGTELEVDRRSPLSGEETTEKTAKTLIDAVNGNEADEKLYLKIDRSLKFGFELVSHPMTLAYHFNAMPWKNIMDYLLGKGYISNSAETCGLHIHVNRNSLGNTEDKQTEAIARILMFVENNWDEILVFSRRTAAQMNRWAARYGTKNPDELKAKAKDKASSDRYTCVNLRNIDTIEFRMFRGTLNYTVFAAALQFVNALCDMAVYCSDEEAETMSWAEFTKRLNVIKEKDLIDYLKSRSLYA